MAMAAKSVASKSVIIGTAGHIDHGKSRLVEALTGTHPDRLEEEKRRGITIDLGFAFLEEHGVRFGFVDVPGHERFVSNMLAGASGIDVLLLVIAAALLAVGLFIAGAIWRGRVTARPAAADSRKFLVAANLAASIGKQSEEASTR